MRTFAHAANSKGFGQLIIATIAAGAIVAATLPEVEAHTIERVNVSPDGTEDPEGASRGAISPDGRYVTFASWYDDLLPGGEDGVFVLDRQTDELSWVVASMKERSVSDDAHYVAFKASSDLLPGGNNPLLDIYVRDRVENRTFRVSVSANGESGGPSISGNGRFVAFHSYADNLAADDTNDEADVFVRDIVGGITRRVSVNSDREEATGGASVNPSISANGDYVAFRSSASDLVEDDTNGEQDVFVRDIAGGTTTRVSVSTGGAGGNGYSYLPRISADGRHVVFNSEASNLVAGDTNGGRDVFV